MSTQTATNRHPMFKTHPAHLATIREFLALPGEVLPAAMDLGDDLDGSAVWDILRAAAKDDSAAMGATILLTADRDGWRDGRRVVVK